MGRTFNRFFWGLKLTAWTLAVAGAAPAAELTPETLHTWNEYTEAARARMESRLVPGHPFLWADEQPGRAKRLRSGELQVAPFADHGSQSVPNGLIHDWVGAIFLPHTSFQDLAQVLQNYDRYQEFYKPLVVESRCTKHASEADNGIDRFSMRWLHKVLFVTAAMDTENQSQIFRVDESRHYSISSTVTVREIQNYGKPNQRVLPPDEGNGFVWRLYGIARYQERDGGLYFEMEAIALTRDIPSSVRWMVKPAVTKLSRNSVLVSLTQTRDAIRNNAQAPLPTGASLSRLANAFHQ